MSDGEEPNTKKKFHVGEKVRVSTTKITLEKGYEAKYSEEIFIIIEIKKNLTDTSCSKSVI